MGADSGNHTPWDFNPHSPCGERRFQVFEALPDCVFQSTLPLRGATHRLRHREGIPVFQSTLPLRGATILLNQHSYQ